VEASLDPEHAATNAIDGLDSTYTKSLNDAAGETFNAYYDNVFENVIWKVRIMINQEGSYYTNMQSVLVIVLGP
jgi:NADPH-dependent curcumin reductase CurA